GGGVGGPAAVGLRAPEPRERRSRGHRPPPAVRAQTVILVDDGLATGSTMRAAIEALRRLEPARIVAAVPVADPTTCEEIAAEADEVVCARTPRQFRAVGLWYTDFSQTTDDEVRDLLQRAAPLWHATEGREPETRESRRWQREGENGAER